jgi:hypothetical protein
MDHEIPTLYSLIADLFEGLCEASGTPVLPKGHDSISKARYDFVTVVERPFHLAEEPLRAFHFPMLRHHSDPRNAGVLISRIRLKAVAHVPISAS